MIWAESASEFHRLGVLLGVVGVGTAKFNRRRVVVNLAGSNIKGLHRLNSQGPHQAGPITLEEPIQSSAQSVISQGLCRSQSRIIGLRPLLDALEGVGLQQNTFNQQFQRSDIMGRVNLLTEQRTQMERPEEVIDQGQSSPQFCSQT